MKILEKVSPKFNSFVDGVMDIENRQWEHGYVDDLLLDMENEEEFDPDRDSWDLEELIVNWHELKHAKNPRWEPRLSDMRLDFLERVFQEELRISSDQEPEGDSNLASMVDDDRCKFVPQVVAWVLDDQWPGKAPRVTSKSLRRISRSATLRLEQPPEPPTWDELIGRK